MKKILQWLLIGVALMVLVACGGGGGNPDSQAQKKTISGYVVDDPIDGATVTLLSLGQEELNSTVTDSNGSYTLTVAEDKISDGYILEATGGKMNGVDFNETLRAIYKASDDVSHANITLITSLVAKMAMDDNSTNRSGNILSKRDNALKKLIDMGMVKASDWFTDAPSLVNMDELRATVQADGLDDWLSSMRADLTDAQLSRDKMGIFGMAHGGVLSVIQNNKLLVATGKEITIDLFAETNASMYDRNITITLLDNISFATINNNKLSILLPLSSEPYSSIPLNISISKNGVLIGRATTITLSITKEIVLAEGDLDEEGGIFYNNWKDISVGIIPNLLTKSHHIKLIAELNKENQISIGLESNPPLTEYEESELNITVPTGGILRNNYFNIDSSAISTRAISRASNINYDGISSSHECISTEIIDYTSKGFIFKNIWQVNAAYFGKGLKPWSSRRYKNIALSKARCSSRLWSVKQKNDSTLLDNNKEPVLLVHGFILTGVLGAVDGSVYFNNFAKVLQSTDDFLPFEFEWQTNSRFQDVALELKRAIKEIAEKTGKQVHIIGHSFGGVLARVMMQTANNKGFVEKYVATLTTVGSPHSGVFAGFGENMDGKFTYKRDKEINFNNDISFPNGVDGQGNGIAACPAISCYQEGSGTDLTNMFNQDTSYNIYGTYKEKGYIPYFLANTIDNYPSVPTQILIGMTTTDVKCEKYNDSTCQVKYQLSSFTDSIGDYLISRKGQRVYPKLEGVYQDTLGHENIEEHILNIYSVENGDDYRGVYDGIFDVIYGSDDLDVDKGAYSFKISKSLFGNIYIKHNNLINVTKYNYASKDADGNPIIKTGIKYDDKEQFKNYSTGYYHRTAFGTSENTLVGGGILPVGFNVNKYDFAYLYRHSQVGLSDCTTSVGCKNSTWLYFKTFAEEHPATEINPPSEIVARGTVEYRGVVDTQLANASINRDVAPVVPFLVTIEAYTGSFSDLLFGGATTTLKNDGTYELNVTYSPDTNYTVIAYPQGDTMARIGAKVRASASKFLTTFSTLEESILQFPTITLYDTNYQEGNLTIKVVDGQSATVLNGFDAQITNTTGVNVDEGNTNGINSGYISTQAKGKYTVKISKEGYNDGEAECTINANETTECIVNIVSSAALAEGEVSVVMSWGISPSDLDSHLVRKTNGNQDYHVYYGHKNDTDANLDTDAQRGVGPETITISSINPNSVYTYYVYKYSSSGNELKDSGAKIELNVNGSQIQYNVPNEVGRYWKVFEIIDGRIIPCVSGCVQNDTSTLIRSIDRDASIFRNLPAK